MLFAKSFFSFLPLVSALTPVIKRQAGPEGNVPSPALTSIVPSPGAAPILVTKQYQAVTTFVPVLTVCSQPAQSSDALLPASSSPSSHCDVHYSLSVTTVCYTELSGLVSKATVTSCSQPVTFSERLGYRSNAPDPSLRNKAGPSVDTVTTYFVAPWQQLTASGPPSASVTARICGPSGNSPSNSLCTNSPATVQTSVITQTTSYAVPLKVNTFISGPATVQMHGKAFQIDQKGTSITLDTHTMTSQAITSTSVDYTVQSPAASPASSPVSTSLSSVATSSSADVKAQAPESLFISKAADLGSGDAVRDSQTPSHSVSPPSTSTRTVTETVTVSSDSASQLDRSASTRTTTVTSTGTIVQSVTMTRAPAPAAAPLKLLSNSTNSS